MPANLHREKADALQSGVFVCVGVRVSVLHIHIRLITLIDDANITDTLHFIPRFLPVILNQIINLLLSLLLTLLFPEEEKGGGFLCYAMLCYAL
ncbi:hypothetical protein, partial [Bacteroides pyogenes]|uniref:hypothetical protein n=1 Tax=Bacteroides pyogenes TaxID=310300 RepID=UPI00373701EA